MAAKLDVKLTQLCITLDRTSDVLDSNRQENIERHRVTLKTIMDSINKMRLTVEESKIEAKEDLTEITKWNGEIDAKLAEADKEIERLRDWMEERKQEQEKISREQQFTYEAKLHETRMKFQEELVAFSNVKTGEEWSKSGKRQLPGLAKILGQFIETIDKTSIAPITKFTYLCELLDHKIKPVIDSLPFTAEGYNRAKAILEERFGKESEIVKSYVKDILDLPCIPNANPKKISEFSERLNHCVQALQTMKKISQVDGNVSMTLDKLPAIRGDLVRTDPSWEKWNFAQLSEAIRQWTRRNPVDPSRDKAPVERATKSFYLSHRECVYCGDANHKAATCNKIVEVAERKQILKKKRPCFNCAIGSHRAADCSSKSTCQHCGRRHHSSICDSQEVKEKNKKDIALATNHSSEGVLPVLIVKVDGVKCRALIDSGSSSSYISAKLVDILKAKPVSTQTKQVEMLMSSKCARMEIYQLKMQSVSGSFEMAVKFIKVNKSELLTIDNAHYAKLIRDNAHLSRVKITDNDKKNQLPVHAILGSGEYARIKTQSKPLVGNEGEPVAELTNLGWFVMSPGAKIDRETMLLTQTSQGDYEDLCRMDVLGLAVTSENDQGTVHLEFKEQLVRSAEGWYESGLPWRGNHLDLPNNKQGSLQCLESLTRRLQRKGQFSAYNSVIQEQLEANIVEKAPEEVSGKEFYIPHKAVVRESASTTKLRIVYDASARASPDAPSLNECLNPGPALQNRLWDVLVHQRAYPVAVTGDIRQAFLQIRIRESERDALRFHWKTSEGNEIETYRFTRALFGLAPSPFLLNGVLEAHLDAWEKDRLQAVAELRRSLYVDDLVSGGQTVQQAQQNKQESIEILQDATFQLHKWNSNHPDLEEVTSTAPDSEVRTYAKQQLDVKAEGSKMLGLKWDKHRDTLNIVTPIEEAPPTKRGILRKLARIYDPLGFLAPLTLTGKQIYREVCECKLPWDAPLNSNLLQVWKKWQQQLPAEYEVPRPITYYQEAIEEVELHAFGDASGQGVGAAVYSVIQQCSETTQCLVAAKSRLAKKGLTIPRLELVGAHMATNLLVNVCNALDNIPTPKLYGWIDSVVALHWIMGNGQYKQFVANRVAKIQQHGQIQWRHVPSSDNPADLASRGGSVQLSTLWQKGPKWLQTKQCWPENRVTQASPASEKEARMTREIVNVAKVEPDNDVFDDLLTRVSLQRALRIGVWIRRFVLNCKSKMKKLVQLRWKKWKRNALGGSNGSREETDEKLTIQRPKLNSTYARMRTA